MEAKYPTITLSELPVEKIKTIYFPDQPWADCYKEVAQKFTALKQIMRKFYTDKEEIEMLRELATYSKEDIQDAFNSVSHRTL